MLIQSLGLQSDMIFHRADAQIFERGNYMIIMTPDNPLYFFGNLLLFDHPPQPNGPGPWEALFAEAFADQPASTHRTFVWDNTGLGEPAAPDAISAFESFGYEYKIQIILAADAVNHPLYPNHEVLIRGITTEMEWEAVYELQVLGGASDYNPDLYRPFIAQRIVSWRRMIDAGRGIWLGAFDGNRLVADCGLFWEDGVGRFQNVETLASHRRRGICGTLVHHGCELALEKCGVRNLVMAADKGYVAARIYESLGFKRAERLGSLCKYDRLQWEPTETMAAPSTAPSPNH